MSETAHPDLGLTEATHACACGEHDEDLPELPRTGPLA